MGNYISRTGASDFVATVQPYDDYKARKTIVLPEATVDCLRDKIIEVFGESPESALHIYYRAITNPLTHQPRYLLSKNADLIAGHFGVGTNVCVYYQHSKTDAKTIINNEKSLKLALINSDQVFFESLDNRENKTIPNETRLSIVSNRDAKSRKNSGLFISYNWSTKVHVNAVVDKLQAIKPDLLIWRDTEKMESDIYDSMGSGISGCQVVIACFSLGYLQSRNCMKELKFADELKKTIIPVYFFEDADNIDSLKNEYSSAFLIVAGKLYTNFKRMNPLDSEWDLTFNGFVKEVESALSKVPHTLVVSPLDVWLQPESFDADLQAYAEEYVPGTRKWIVPALKAWTLTKERVMYLNGGAGTGKSLIVYSLTKNLPTSFVIGALFICRYNNARKSNPIVLVCTIVSSLCLALGGAFKQHVEAEMKEDLVCVKEGKQSLLKTPIEAFKVLVVDGLNKCLASEWQSKTLLIIIDALDELNKDTRHSVLTILTVLCPQLPEFVKIITTGRPERDIYYLLQELSPFVLSPSSNNNTADLELCCGENSKRDSGREVLQALVDKAEGLFIYARNVSEYIKNQNLTPKQALTDIQSLTSGSDGVYKAIIERELQSNRAERLALFKHVFAVLLTAQRPLTLTSLSNLGGLALNEVESVVAEFRSILKIEVGGVVSAIHKSVKDFFTDNTRCGAEFFIQITDASLAVRCVQILIVNLSRNMATLDPARLYSKDELTQLTVLNEDVEYAVLFWGTHFSLGFSSASVHDQNRVIMLLHQFCTKTLVYYLEALLLMTKLNDVFAMIESVSFVLSSCTHLEDVKTVLSLLTDLKYVAFNFRTQLLASPLQVYNHALIGVPQETMYYQLYSHLASAHITIGAEKKWGPFTLVGHSGVVYSVAFSPDGKTVVSGSNDKTVKVWSVETGECVKTIVGHSALVNCVVFLPDSKTVVSGSNDKTIKVWSVETGKCVKTFGHSGEVYSVAFSPDYKTMVCGSFLETFKLWSVETGENFKTFKGHKGGVSSIVFSPDGKTLVSRSNDRTVKIWSVETAECVKTLPDAVSSIAVSPDSKTVISGAVDRTLKLWSLETGECIKSFVGSGPVAFSPDGKTVISGANNHTLKLWSVETGECVKTFEGHTEGVLSVAFSPDGKTVVSGSIDKTVKLWPLETGELSKNPQGHSDWVNSVTLSPDGKTVATGSDDRTVKVWSVETGECVKTLKGHYTSVRSVGFSPDSKTVISGSHDLTVKMWCIETGECFRTFEGHYEVVICVAVSSDSKTVVSGSTDRTIRVWSVETGENVKTIVGHSDGVYSVAFSPDSKTMVSGSNDKTVKVWCIETGECLKTFEGHSGNVRSVAFSLDSMTVVSGSDDGTVKLWSVETGECLQSHIRDAIKTTQVFFVSAWSVLNGWLSQDLILLYFFGKEFHSISHLSVAWIAGNNVCCLTLKN
ncbi:WD40 repeat-like protein [Rhizoclosmatium globosum]|uniref:WD40 repeat-like protein n=1 Tax=Rhizoclosmatium globosum TaxID=329046 RepID=A0A1Y2BCD9_9FUNG|nr:WD40 repeat-like protein [Rhizoclosmatium globosum]|eukprot:ORY32489.1 WD40 repeat-like protein [Rhizoclosmatium globosum]